MKFSIFIIILFQFNFVSFGQTRYFDENNKTISKSKFNKKEKSRDYLPIPGDSVNHKKLIRREQSGQINNRALLIDYFKQELKLNLDTAKPMVIIYHPGQDECNSSGSADENWIKNWHKELQDELLKIAGVKPIYVYKEKSGLEKYQGIVNWYKDPDHIIGNLFFKHHYPCGSFVVISKSGEYISYLGEYPHEFVLMAAKKLAE